MVWGCVFTTVLTARPTSNAPSAVAGTELLRMFTERLVNELVNHGLLTSEGLQDIRQGCERSSIPEVTFSDEDIPL